MMMLQSSCVYYSDATCQLDLNLKYKSQELISMLEQFEREHCLVCYQLKCACAGANTTKQPKAVPLTPEKKIMNEEIEAWMKASKLKEKADMEKKIQQIKHNLLNNNSCNGAAVDTFFRCFKMPPNASVAYLSNKLAEAFMQVKKKKPDHYSYF